MPLQATSGAASYDAFGGGVAAVPNYIEDVFSTWLYNGDTGGYIFASSGVSIVSGGMMWVKSRGSATNNYIFSPSLTSANHYLNTNTTAAQSNSGVSNNNFEAINNGGGMRFGGAYSGISDSATGPYASWSWAKAPKFFDVVTYTGNGSAVTVNHNLGSTPGCIIIKATSNTGNWHVWHRSVVDGSGYGYLVLNSTAATAGGKIINSTSSTDFVVASGLSDVGYTYVCYVFAHNAGGFGLTGSDNVISCGSYTGTGSTLSVTLGYEPQWVMIKRTDTTADWQVIDNMRGWTADGVCQRLVPNTSLAEAGPTGSTFLFPTATGFGSAGSSAIVNASGGTYIYIAIRRGPMKVPTSGTSVFQPVAYTGTNVDNRLVDTGIVTDMTMARIRTATSGGGFYTADRLRGNYYLSTATTGAQATDPDTFMTPTVGYGNSFSAMNGFGVGNDVNAQLNQSSTDQLAYAFRRSPNFFDEVFYTGTGTSGQTFDHNLGAVPDLMIVKFTGISSTGWMVYVSALTNASTSYLVLNSANTVVTGNTNVWNSTAPTSSVFTLGANSNVNFTGDKYVAYLFASCPNVSKVGSYTGTGTTLQVNCGFTAGARFVLIKRTNSTGDWYVWDSARGIVAGNDPYLLLNTTGVDVTNTDYIDTYSAGFEISSTAPAAINASGGTFIFLAIA